MHHLLPVVTPDPTWGERRVVCNYVCCVDAFALSSTREGKIVSVSIFKSPPLKSAVSIASLAAIMVISAPAWAQQAMASSATTNLDSAAAAGDAAPMAPPATPSAAAYGPPVVQQSAPRGEVAIDWQQAPAVAPPALVQALDLISRNYPSVRGARAAIRAATSDVRGAQWQRFPNVSVQTSFVGTGNTVAPSVSVSAPVWTAGRLGATIKRARAALDASEAQYREVVLGLAVDTTQLYFDIARLTRREAMIAESLEEHRALVASMERRVAQEVSPLADLELARSRVAQIEQEYAVAKAQRQASLYAFAELVNDPSFNIGNVPQYKPDIQLTGRATLMDEALGYDPTLQRLQAQIMAGRAEVSATKASIFPQLNAQYTYNDYVGSRVGLVATLDTAGGLSRFSAVSSARARLDTATAQLSTAQRQIRQRINNDLTEFDSAQARAAVSRDASFTSNNVSESYMRQFIAGRRSWLDVMNSLRETLSARLGQADAEISAMSSFVRLSLRTGRWTPFVDSSK